MMGHDGVINATALEASQTQEPRHFCEACEGRTYWSRGFNVTSTLRMDGCHFHTRCAIIWLAEDNLPHALANGHDTISCPYQNERSRHRF